MGQIKQAFAQLGNGIRNDFYKLRREFTARSFFTLLFGAALLGGNAYLFVASAIRMFAADGVIVGLLHFSGGLFGFLISCLLIFLITVHFSVTPQSDTVYKKDDGVFSDSMSPRGRIFAIILVALLTFGGGGAALGYYIGGEVKYNSYPQVTATVVALENAGFDKGYAAVYEYTVDGQTYRVKGPSTSSGEAVPRVGDTVNIRYNPLKPDDIRISTESKFFLGFGCFLIYVGLASASIWLYSAKKLKTQFLLAFLLLGLTACIFTMYLTSTEFTGLVAFFARNFMLHFIMMFTNVGFLELINGIVYLGYKPKNLRYRRR